MGAWVGAALTGLGALSGLFAPKKTTTDQSFNNTSTPVYDPTNLAFRNQLISQWSNLAGGAGSGQFQQGYTTGGLNNINKTSQQAQQSISDMLTARGLGRTTAGAGTLGDVSLSQANQTAQFLNNVPLVMDQRMQQILAGASGYQAALPVGQNQQGSSHTVTTGPGAGTGSPLAGGIMGGSAGLATYLGQINANNNFAAMLKAMGMGGGGPGATPSYSPVGPVNPYSAEDNWAGDTGENG